MSSGVWSYIKAAFNARPAGMFVPPNWVGLAAFGMLGVLNPGFWLIGAGLELGYLYTVASNRRFRRFVNGARILEQQKQWQQKLASLLGELSGEDQNRYRSLERRCQTLLRRQQDGGMTPDLAAQGEGLARLLWIYLRLLLTRQSLMRVLRASASVDLEPLDKRLRRLRSQMQQESISEELRRSLGGQVEIIQQRLEKQDEARQKLQFLEAELVRIEEQVELIREQAALSSDPHVVSTRIDEIAATLGGTTQWIREQQRIFGQVEDLLTEPPPVMVAERMTKE